MRGLRARLWIQTAPISNPGFDSSCVTLGKLLNFSVLQPFSCLKKKINYSHKLHKSLGRITQDHAIYKKSLSPSPQPLHAGVCDCCFFMTGLFLGNNTGAGGAMKKWETENADQMICFPQSSGHGVSFCAFFAHLENRKWLLRSFL